MYAVNAEEQQHEIEKLLNEAQMKNN